MTTLITVESLGLPTTKSEINKNYSAQKFLMLGASKIGKTEFWAQDDTNFFIRTERGHNHVQNLGMDCTDWNDVEKVIGKLTQASAIKPFPYLTIIVDTGDRLLDFANEHVVQIAQERYKSREINGIGEIPEGVGWFMLKQLMNNFLGKFEKLPCAKAMIFHLTTDEREDESGKKYKIDTINLGGKTGKAMMAWYDHIMHIKSQFVGEQLARTIICKPSKTVEAGSRGQMLPEKIQWTNDSKANWIKFRAFFN